MAIPAVRKSVLWTMAVLLGAALSLSPAASSAEQPERRDSAKVTKLLKQARSQAVQLRKEADKLEAYKFMGLSRETHARQLDITKDHVNDLGRTLEKLEARKFEASPWQQKAIAEMRPVLEQLAARTTSAIEHVNANPHQLRHPDYHETLSDKADLSVKLADLLNDHVKYGDAKADLEEAEAQVGPLP